MTSKLHVAIVTRFPANPADPCGGVEAVSVKLVHALSQLEGLNISVVTTDSACLAANETQWGTVRIMRLPQPQGKLLSYAMRDGRRQVRAALHRLQPDVVHAHDVYGLMVQGMSGPRAFTVHGFIHEDTRLSGDRWASVRAWMWKRAETAAWADQPHIISISPYVREYIRHYTPADIHDIDNPVGEAFFELERKEVPGRIFSAVGSINPRKNVMGLVRAIATLRQNGVEAELRISGGVGDKDYHQQVLNYISDNRLDSCVKLLGRLSHDQIYSELSSAAVFALVSREENSPISIEEAMASAIPVVTSNRCGMPYMVRHGESGYLVDPENTTEIAEHLQMILNNRDLGTTMGMCGRRIALERFHPNKVAKRTSVVYHRLANGSTGAS